MSRWSVRRLATKMLVRMVPRWLFIGFGAVAATLGVTGIAHATRGITELAWGILTVVGIASLGLGLRKWFKPARR